MIIAGGAMVQEQSAEEVLEQCLRDMGPELGAVYGALRNDVAWIHAKWEQYRQLFARSPERIDLLNQAASHLFGMIQESLLENVVLNIARLTDPPRSKGKDNLTIQRLPPLISDEWLRRQVESLLEAALSECKFARDWRNRRLAHRDLALTLASSYDPLPGVSRADIEAALGSVRAVLNRLAKFYWDSETGYQYVITSGRDADALVHFLSLGLRAEEERLERLQNGQFLPDDFKRVQDI